MVLPELGLRFATLERRLIEALRMKIANGEITERGLARRIGVSQPHIHNILKGLRSLTPGIADMVLEELGMNALDLVTVAELGAALTVRNQGDSPRRHVRFAEGCISPALPFPDLSGGEKWVEVVSGAFLRGLKRPVFVQIMPDAAVAAEFTGVEAGLLELDETERVRLLPTEWYVVRWGGVGYIRQIRKEEGRLVLRGQETLWARSGPTEIPLSEASVLQIVRARLVWTGADPRNDHSVLLRRRPEASS